MNILSESFDMEAQADFYAAVGDLRNAVRLMREVNAMRAQALGLSSGAEPRLLRDLAWQALHPEPEE